jgi:hypothetical protein
MLSSFCVQRSDAGQQRRRTGIEPARELVAPSTVLKTAEPTRNPDASAPKAIVVAGPVGPVAYD